MATNRSKFAEAIESLGGPETAAERLGVSKSYVYFMKAGQRGISPEICIAIEKATRGKFRCEHIRPDIEWSVVRRKPALA